MTMQPIIKGSRVRVAERPRRESTTSAPPANTKHAEPVRIDGAVRAIEFRCDCGEVTVLELEYDEPRAAGAAEAKP